MKFSFSGSFPKLPFLFIIFSFLEFCTGSLYLSLYNSESNIKFARLSEGMFEARLEEVSVFRKIIDSLKELVKMVNIEVNTKGLSIQAMDSCHVALVSLVLKEKAFTHYTCHKPLTLGLTIENVAKILKLAGNEDSMTLLCEDEPTALKFRFESKRKPCPIQAEKRSQSSTSPS
jgi:DNA polymerase III sliding clamp (beta) subunit (PCNA family)